MSGWQTIETAPKDGSLILLAFPGPFRDHTESGIATGQWAGTGWWLTCIWAAGRPLYEPTHWMAIPSAPTE